MNTQYKVDVLLPVNIFKEDKEYVAACPIIKLSTTGKTIKKAKDNFHEAFQVWIETAVHEGILDDLLKDLGWHCLKNKMTYQPRLISESNPLPLCAQTYEQMRIPTPVSC